MPFFKRRWIAGAAVLLLTPGAGWCDETRTLPRIHAVGPLTPLAERDADICADTCIDGRSFLIDALAARPGLIARQTGRFGGTASIRVRGAPAGHTLVLIDGVPINDASTPDGGFDFARIGSRDIARVEVYKGADTVMWGAGAGVINIISAQPRRQKNWRAAISGGAWQTLAGSLSLAGGGHETSGRLTVDGLTTGGISKAADGTERDGFSRLGVFALWRTERSGINLRAGVRYGAAQVEYDGFDPVAPGFVSDADRFGISQDIAAHAGLTWRSGTVRSDMFAAATQIERRDYNAGVESFSARANGIMLRYHADIALTDRYRWLAGASWHHSDTLNEWADRFSAFALHELGVDSTRIGIGLRGDLDSHGARLGVSADIARRIGSIAVVRAGWGSGHVAPTSYQRTAFFPPATAPAASGLATESSQNWSAGADWQHGNAALRLTAFARSSSNQIAYRDGRYVNLDRSESSGIELSARLDLTSATSVNASLTALNASQNGKPALDLPGLIANTDLNVVAGRLSVAVSARHVGAHRQFAGQVDAWTRLDVSARYRLTGQIEIHARIENLLDLRYQETLGYGTPRRSAQIGIGISPRTATDLP